MKGSCESAVARSERESVETSPRCGTPHVHGAAGCASAASGDVIDGRYVLRELIGTGGMSDVFAADQPSLGRSVAIKLLHARLFDVPHLVRGLREEAALACRVRDPHCVAVFDSGVLPDGTPYMVMEHVVGRTLGRMIAENAIAMPSAVELFEQVLAALAVLHRSDIVHGDVKSDNFLVEQRHGADHVVLIDFGLARLMGEPLRRDRADRADRVGVIAGTPEYMAPELAEARAPCPATDLYGAGVILYELLTGTVPRTASLETSRSGLDRTSCRTTSAPATSSATMVTRWRRPGASGPRRCGACTTAPSSCTTAARPRSSRPSRSMAARPRRRAMHSTGSASRTGARC